MKRHKKQRRGVSHRLEAGIVVLAFILAFAVFLIGNAYEHHGSRNEPGKVGDRFADVTVEYGSQTYRCRKDEITTVLFMGIDRESGAEVSGSQYRNGGQSDFLLLLLIDNGREQLIPLQINRDTLAEITILGVLGDYLGTRRLQICLSHSFGDGGTQSCEFTKQAVSTLLLGMDIDFYVAMNLDGISVLNDALGGITVTLTDDFSAYDPLMTPGKTLTLHGKQAEYYVRSRYYIGEQTNASRMIRQRDYLRKMADVVVERERMDQNYIGELYDRLEPYLTTDMHKGRMINEAWRAKDYELRETVTPAGTYGMDTHGLVTFEAEPTALKELTMELFFEPVPD